MKTFDISGVLVKDILQELAKKFKSELSEHLTEYTLSFPEALGEGKIQGLNFPNGVGLLNFQGKLNQKIALNFKNKEVHPLKFIYCTKGNIRHTIKPEKKGKKVQQYQSAIVSSYYNYGHIYSFPADEDFSIQVIEVDRKRFKAHIDYKLEDIPYHFYEMFADVEGVNKIFHKSDYSLRISGIIEEIENLDAPDLARVNYLGARALEMMAHMLTQYDDDIRDDKTRHILRKSELETVGQVEKYIRENLVGLETIEELAKKFGLSKLKLQQGFQLEYKHSINEYLTNIRLEKALDYLDEGEKNISEIVYALGLSSRSYFSKIFKERYRISPSQYLKAKKEA